MAAYTFDPSGLTESAFGRSPRMGMSATNVRVGGIDDLHRILPRAGNVRARVASENDGRSASLRRDDRQHLPGADIHNRYVRGNVISPPRLGGCAEAHRRGIMSERARNHRHGTPEETSKSRSLCPPGGRPQACCRSGAIRPDVRGSFKIRMRSCGATLEQTAMR
jgi:hypothetical protein